MPARAKLGLIAAALALGAAPGGPAPAAAAAECSAVTPASAPAQRNQLPRPGEGTLHRAEATVEDTAYDAGLAAGVPQAVMDQAMEVFGRFVDLQHEVDTGDRFEVVWARAADAENGAGHSLVAATVERRGEHVSIVRYTPPGGTTGFFTMDGVSVGGLLLRTPVDGAALSSPFGPREHPILGYTRMHRGLDYAAPAGTPILAAGAGTVEAAGRNGGYGNYVRIRHDDRYATAYAHMRSIAAGIEPGAAVRQGEVIGEVGTTGVSTGPHLHYEVLEGGEQIDPAGVPDMPRQVLCGVELKAFHWHVSLMPLRPAGAPLESARRDGE